MGPRREHASKSKMASVAVRWPGGMTLSRSAESTGSQPASVLTAASR
jgi:hypothetical protein